MHKKHVCTILYVFVWVFPRHLIFVCRCFGTLYLFHLHMLDMKNEVYFILHIQPMKMEQIECSETSAYNNQTPGKYPNNTYKIQNTPKVWNQEYLCTTPECIFNWNTSFTGHEKVRIIFPTAKVNCKLPSQYLQRLCFSPECVQLLTPPRLFSHYNCDVTPHRALLIHIKFETNICLGILFLNGQWC